MHSKSPEHLQSPVLRPYRYSNCAARVRRSAVTDSRREENTRIICPEMPLISNPWPSSRRPFQAEPAGERLFQVLGDDCGDRAAVLVVVEGARPPFPVGDRLGSVGDLGVYVQLHIPVPRRCAATARSASFHWPVSRPCTWVPCEGARKAPSRWK